VLRLLRGLEDSLGTTSDAARHRHLAALESARQVARWWRQQVHNTAMAGAEPPELPPDAVAPPPLRQLIADEPAVETLADMLRGHRRGILMAPGALAGWLDSTAGRVRRHRNRSAWLRWWSAIPPGAAVSVLGTMEPGSAAAAVAGDDGLVARLLFACPEPGPPQALSDRTAPLGPAALAALARLRDLPEPPRVVPLSAGARIRFEDFRQAHAVAASRLDGAEAAWWSKGPASVLRLAGVLAFLAWASQPEGTAEPPMLELGTLEAGADLWQRYLWPHARAVVRSGGIDREPDIKVLRWIRQHAKAQVSREDLRARALCRTCDAAETDLIAARLVAEGWLRPVESVHRPPGRPPIRWVVHPRLCEARDA
ncbi:DUF3987 domain-containing protein, partial [Vineibacter terrae]|uniref:DUF3987 domain-containing protein n=1 Tax=Vineibacter terrae TaxID=2586908 RepID=UPI002E37B735